MKLKLCSGSKKRLLSRTLASSLLLGSMPFNTFAGTLSDDGRYETFEGDSITIDNVLEEDEVDVEIEGNTLVNVSSTKDETPVTPSKVDTSGNHVSLNGDGYINPLIEGNTLVNLFRESDNVVGDRWGWINFSSELLNPNITYTIIVNNLPDLKNIRWCLTSYDNNINDDKFLTQYTNSNMATFSSDSYAERLVLHVNNNQVDEIMQEQLDSVKVIILEGDYTDKELPEYFTGLKSSFEDNLITQEMMNSGQEKAENLGKYKIEVKSTGKNKWSFGDRVGDVVVLRSGDKPILKKGTYTVTSKSIPEYDYPQVLRFENKNRNILVSIQLHTTYTFTLQDDVYGFVLYSNGYEYSSSIGKVTTFKDIQIEEGSVATEYEPYKESIKTFYLNSPLLEGDTIEFVNGKPTHIKRYGEVALDGSENWVNHEDGTQAIMHLNSTISGAKCYSDTLPTTLDNDFKEGALYEGSIGLGIVYNSSALSSLDKVITWLQNNPTTVVYKLAKPIYETISDESMLIDSYKDGHLDFDTNIPLSSVKFLPLEEELQYLYNNKKYSIQFESDNNATADIYLGGAELLNQNIVKGLNKFEITTPSTLIDNKLILSGVGFNVSKVVVTEYTKDSFGYFEGMSSVGDNEELEIKYSNKNLIDSDFRNWTPFIVDGITYEILDGGAGYKTVFNNSWNAGMRLHNVSLSKGRYYIGVDADTNQVFDVYMKSKTDSEHVWIGKNKFFELKEDFNGTIIIKNGVLTGEYVLKNIYINKLNNEGYIKSESGTTIINSNISLKSLPNGVKDSVIKKNGQWVIERKCGEITLDGSEKNWFRYDNFTNDTFFSAYINIPDAKIETTTNLNCDTLIPRPHNRNHSYITMLLNLAIGIESSKLTSNNINGFKQWLSENPTTIVYELAKPIYEPLNIDSTVNLYLDTTHISNDSTIPANMKIVVDRAINRAYEALELVKENPSAINISQSRYWTNLLKESIKKDELQSEINDILNIEDFKIEPKSITSSADIYIIPKNNLTMSLNTNSITFDEFDSTNDLEMLNAVEITINSSLPYELNATLPVGISNSNKDTSLPVNILNIKESNDLTYKTFSNIDEKLTITDESLAGINTHKIDLKLSGGLTNKADVYKTTLKFEAKQK